MAFISIVTLPKRATPTRHRGWRRMVGIATAAGLGGPGALRVCLLLLLGGLLNSGCTWRVPTEPGVAMRSVARVSWLIWPEPWPVRRWFRSRRRRESLGSRWLHSPVQSGF